MQCSCPIQIDESSVNTENGRSDRKVRTEVSLNLNQGQAADRHVRITSDTGKKSVTTYDLRSPIRLEMLSFGIITQ